MAKQLLKEAIKDAKSEQIKEIMLEVRESNEAAIFLYEKIGKVYPVFRFFIDFISKFLKNITILLIFVSKC